MDYQNELILLYITVVIMFGGLAIVLMIVLPNLLFLNKVKNDKIREYNNGLDQAKIKRTKLENEIMEIELKRLKRLDELESKGIEYNELEQEYKRR